MYNIIFVFKAIKIVTKKKKKKWELIIGVDLKYLCFFRMQFIRRAIWTKRPSYIIAIDLYRLPTIAQNVNVFIMEVSFSRLFKNTDSRVLNKTVLKSV